MNINKDGRTLYFSDEEIDNDTNGEKKVFVTKRINGKESHIKAQKINPKHQKRKETSNDETFNFNNEIVIGVNVVEERENNKKGNKKRKKGKNRTDPKLPKTKKGKNRTDPKLPKKQKGQNRTDPKLPRQKRNRPKIAIAFITAILLIAIVTIFALTAPIFNITQIQVQGNEKLDTNTILTLSGLKKEKNIFQFNTNSIIKNIKENTYVESVKIKRKLPGTVLISIEERKVKYQINFINSYAYIDKNGYILENSTVKQQVPVLVGLNIKEDEMLNKERLKTEDLEKLNEIAKIMDAAKTIQIDSIISEINTENKEEYILYIESKSKKIYIGDTSNLTNKMLYVQRILENEEGKKGSAFVNGDISSGFKPYFREEN